ncbi:type II toxin-antitoxin system VapC family toxin [Litorilinea aerophila]|uniref:Ribonuclease VapC n=1 Tax=Litorilinea aerophila TaxID=1204385 RepID=A0A540V8B7_9CHLR|nr:type II toxin-antitoxin system VapC family toxin [Litorilinea aerophila]MCC9079048.1 type II toxin-antitoxin system VapC family toxin [Litorilinea aerophila]OUC04965.1 hypothetical protein RY27_30135 [Litorilinea aerophila]
MSRPVAIDSNVLVALIDRQDKWHRQAQALLAALKTEGASLVYFDCVLNETISVMARRAQEQRRSAEFSMLLDELLRRVPEDAVTWISVDTQRLFNRVIELIRNTGGALNFHDALIVLACQELGIEAIASFDGDFDLVTGLLRISDSSGVS